MKSKRLKMPFGKYRGRAFPNIPSDYLKWLLTLDNISQEIIDECRNVLVDRYIFAESMKVKSWDKITLSQMPKFR